MEIIVRAVSGATRFEKIVTMIEDSEKLKSNLESKAEHLADRLVPYTLLGTGLVWAVTRNMTKALSVLMVDFSCALKLAMPISVLSAIREAGQNGITVKGGKYLEAVAEADTIVFDKTGTLTKAKPTVKEVIVFGDYPEPEALRIAACLEEHFPHSMAKAVVDAAKRRSLYHEEMHSKVEYIVAHGISSYIEGKKTIIGFVRRCRFYIYAFSFFSSLSVFFCFSSNVIFKLLVILCLRMKSAGYVRNIRNDLIRFLKNTLICSLPLTEN